MILLKYFLKNKSRLDLKNKQTKAILIGTLIGGLVYAGLMTLFDYSYKKDFSIGKFSANFIFFGIFMGWLTYYNLKKQSKK